MAKLHELLAVIDDLKGTAKAIVAEAEIGFRNKSALFTGHLKTISYFDEARTNENEIDQKLLVTTVGDKLAHVSNHLSKLLDSTYQLEEANTGARADLLINGDIIAAGVPAVVLLQWSNKVEALRKLYKAIPTLPPEVNWDADPDTGAGAYKSPPQKTFRTQKSMEHKILVAATDHHPAQVEKWTEDVKVAQIDTTQISGMISPAEKSLMLGRLDTVIAELKKARQRANNTEINGDLKVGKSIFDFIHGI